LTEGALSAKRPLERPILRWLQLPTSKDRNEPATYAGVNIVAARWSQSSPSSENSTV
jgi:hypothetical protein